MQNGLQISDTDNQESSTTTSQLPNDPSNPTESLETIDRLGQGLARCLASQGHLLPVSIHIGPVYWAYDQALSIHPLPNLVVAVEPDPLADLNQSKCSLVSTGNCQFINPGRFGKAMGMGSQNQFAFKVYYPKTGLVEDSCLPE